MSACMHSLDVMQVTAFLHSGSSEEREHWRWCVVEHLDWRCMFTGELVLPHLHVLLPDIHHIIRVAAECSTVEDITSSRASRPSPIEIM